MADWLDVDAATAILGPKITQQIDRAVFTVFVDAAAGYVVSRRPDLFPADVSPDDIPVQVRVGATFLAWRWYNRRTSPGGSRQGAADDLAGIAREDPDIGRMLGIDSHAPFVFGGAPATEVR